MCFGDDICRALAWLLNVRVAEFYSLLLGICLAVAIMSVNTRYLIGVFPYWESNDHPSHISYTSFVKNSPGGTASASNGLVASPTKQVTSQQIGLDLESNGVA